MTRVQVVTGYIPIAGHPRTAKEYGEYGEKMFTPLVEAGVDIKRYMEPVEATWLWKYTSRSKVAPVHSVGDNPAKNSLAYHCTTHQKFGWLLKAAREDPRPDTFVWLDYGIAHVPGVDPQTVWNFLKRIRKGDLAIPGCWPGENNIVSDLYPCWRFCGGVIVVPRERVHKLYKAIKGTALAHVDKTKNVTWEVNTMAEAEQNKRLPKFRWYQADHNETLFTSYAEGLDAEGTA